MLEITNVLRYDFGSKVIKQEGCWRWIGPIHVKNGYGQFWYQNKNYLAHRVAFLIEYGYLDENLIIRHTCDNPGCVNPAHLIQGTQRQNIEDAMSKGRHNHGETHGMCFLKENDIDIIRQKYAHGMTMQSIANEYNVSKQQIWRIIHYKSWSHI